jgi:DNA-binding transcriptional MerR regulator
MLMRIGELADLAGVTPDTVRFYERQGVLASPERLDNGYRNYGAQALEDLRFVRKARSLGLALNDIQEVMEISSGGRPPCDHVRATVQTRLLEVEKRMKELRMVRKTLRKTLDRLDQVPAPSAGCRCPAIEGA